MVAKAHAGHDDPRAPPSEPRPARRAPPPRRPGSHPSRVGSVNNLPPTFFWLVDRSHSVGDNSLDAARRFTAPGTNYGRKIDSQGWIGFAAQPAGAPDLKTLSDLPLRTLDANATDIAGALSFADATFPAGYTKTAVIFTDGQETVGDTAAQITRLRDSGVRVHGRAGSRRRTSPRCSWVR